MSRIDGIEPGFTQLHVLQSAVGEQALSACSHGAIWRLELQMRTFLTPAFNGESGLLKIVSASYDGTVLI